jgi:hypothetical protein
LLTQVDVKRVILLNGGIDHILQLQVTHGRHRDVGEFIEEFLQLRVHQLLSRVVSVPISENILLDHLAIRVLTARQSLSRLLLHLL